MLKIEASSQSSNLIDVYWGDTLWKTLSMPLIKRALKTFPRIASLQELEALWQDWETKEAHQEALKLLNMRNWGAAALMAKLEQKGYSQTSAKKAIQGMKERGYIDDLETARSLIRSMRAKGYGIHRMIGVLKQKKLWDEALNFDILQVQRESLEKALSKLKGKKKDPAALYRSLMRLGFDRETIFSILHH